MIKFQNITKIYPANDPGKKPTKALDEVSFEVESGEFVSLVGKSGSGKTTLLRLLLAEEEPTSGRVYFKGQNVHQIRPDALPMLRRRIGVVFQDYRLLPSKTAYENIAYVMEVIGASDKEIERDVPKVLEIVGLRDKADNFPAELSGGEKQRVAIARSLIHRPDVILADEPTGNLDPYHTLEIIQLLVRIREMGTTVLLATHNKEVINRLGRRVISLENGRMIRDDQRGRFVL
ncbi:MAG: cell division ATP-binding protein FtsE [Candidatus Nealsonbacteria bacterium]|nr:cell division ATP-binding protein FtsE [Candidatus Nealsonbacteria bacterium]